MKRNHEGGVKRAARSPKYPFNIFFAVQNGVIRGRNLVFEWIRQMLHKHAPFDVTRRLDWAVRWFDGQYVWRSFRIPRAGASWWWVRNFLDHTTGRWRQLLHHPDRSSPFIDPLQ